MSGDDDRHFERLQGAGARGAYDCLKAEAELHGLAISHTTGVIPAVKLHDSLGRYLFAFQPAAQHVLFYIRKPALNAAPSLRVEAKRRHPQALENPGGETTIRIPHTLEAKALADWLFSKLPLPQ